MLKLINGGVVAPLGFKAWGLHAGIKPGTPDDRMDLGMLVSEQPCTAAGMFTTNVVKAEPVLLDMEVLNNGRAQAVIGNCFIANACAPDGMETAQKTQALAAAALGLEPSDVLVSSTGVIGVRQNVEAIEAAIPALTAGLTDDPSGSDRMAHAIMTTDTVKKEFACEVELGGKPVRIGGISKGSGMIHPKMGTMLCFLTTDAAISADLLNNALHAAVGASFNRISVDGDMSTNDTCVVLANGLAGNPVITEEGSDYEDFSAALKEICIALARLMAKDGEGATHLLTCTVSGCESEEKAEALAKSVINSSLTKAAIFGADANWGRVLAALGYAGVPFDPKAVDVSFASAKGELPVCQNGMGVPFDEDKAKDILREEEVIIHCNMNEGTASATCWGCDLTYEYVKINGDYRT